MLPLQRGLTALAATLAAVVASAAAAPAAFAAATGTAKVSGTTVIFAGAAGRANLIEITRSGRTVTLDDRFRIKAGAGCRAVPGDTTKVKCTTKKTPKLIKVSLGAKDDYLRNDTGIASVVTGGTGSDQITGGGRADRISGDSGHDYLWGGGGNDIVSGGSGNDGVFGGSGDDTLYGGTGADDFLGGGGDDKLYGEAGSDTLRAGPGDDTLEGGSSPDALFGEAGADELWTEPEGSPGYPHERADGGTGVDFCYTPVGRLNSCELA